jgi:hypothetical protein
MPGGNRELPNSSSALAATHFTQHKEQPHIVFLNLFPIGYHENCFYTYDSHVAFTRTQAIGSLTKNNPL